MKTKTVIYNWKPEHYKKYSQFKSIKQLWVEHSCTIGKRIKATTLREVIEGKAIDITDDGVLEIQLDNGEIKKVYSADIEIQ